MAKKKAKKRSTSSGKKKARAKNLKARPLKAKAAARVRGGATLASPTTQGIKLPGLTANKISGSLPLKDPGSLSFNEPFGTA